MSGKRRDISVRQVVARVKDVEISIDHTVGIDVDVYETFERRSEPNPKDRRKLRAGPA